MVNWKSRDPQASESLGSSKTPRKFTGAPPAPPASPFSEGGSLFSERPSRTAFERERRQEFNLASRFEQTLPLQAGLLLLAACVIVSVGLSGGITDGSNRDLGDFDEIVIMGEEASGKSVFI